MLELSLRVKSWGGNNDDDVDDELPVEEDLDVDQPKLDGDQTSAPSLASSSDPFAESRYYRKITRAFDEYRR